MATNRTIRGLSGRGFRVPNSSAAKKTLKEGGTLLVDVDDVTTKRILSRERDNYIRTQQDAGTFTVTVATPAVFTKADHGFAEGDAVVFTTTGALPTGLTAGQRYFVIAAGLTSSEFEVSATFGGAAVNTSGTQSGTHTVTPASASIIGLSKDGFRIRTIAAGAYANVKTGSGVHKVDLTDGRVLRVLKRSPGKYLSALSATSVNIRGINPAQAGGFMVPDNGSTVLTSNNTNASDGATVTINDRVYTFQTALTEVKSALETNLAGANNDLRWEAVTPGEDGDNITIAYVLPADTDVAVPMDISVTGTDIVVSLEVDTDGSTILTVADDITAAFADEEDPAWADPSVHAAATALVTVVDKAANDGSGLVIALAETPLAGGADPVVDEVLIGADADASLTNLAAAINGSAGEGTDYSTGTTANEDVTASGVTDHAITLSSIAGGDNVIAVSTDEVTYSFSAAELTDGINVVKEGVTASVNPQTSGVNKKLRRHYKSYIEV